MGREGSYLVDFWVVHDASGFVGIAGVVFVVVVVGTGASDARLAATRRVTDRHASSSDTDGQLGHRSDGRGELGRSLAQHQLLPYDTT